MAVGGQFETLLFGPYVNGGETTAELGAPISTAQATAIVQDKLVEEPHAYVVKQLGKQLYGQGGIDTKASQQVHRVVEYPYDVLQCWPFET